MPPRIHVYVAPADKFFVNSFLIETDQGVILVDTQFLVSTAREQGHASTPSASPWRP